MASTTMKFTAVAVVAIFLIAGVGFFLISNDDKGSDVEASVGELPVYGNANKDKRIDSEDRGIIQNIMDNKDGYTYTAYPYADANNDGLVNDKDLDIVNKIINGQTTTIYHMDYKKVDGHTLDVTVQTAKWPIKNAIVDGNLNELTMKLLLLEDNVAASTSKAGGWFDQELLGYLNDPKIMPLQTYGVSIADQLGPIIDKTGTFTMFAKGDNSLERQVIEDMGCDLITMCDENPMINEVISSVLLMGFMFNKTDRAIEISDFYWDIYDKTTKIGSEIPEEKRVKFAVGKSTNTNAYVYKCELAGGVFSFADVDAPIAEGGYSYEWGDWVYKCQIDKELLPQYSNKNTGSFFDAKGPNPTGGLQTAEYYKGHDVYKNGGFYYYSYGLPTIMDVLLMGYIMYPDEFSDLYNESIMTLYGFLGNNEAGIPFADINPKLVYNYEEFKELGREWGVYPF